MACLTEFISVWATGGEASLNLATTNGDTTVGFNCTLGPPGAPHSLPHSPLPPSPAFPTPRRPRHRRREGEKPETSCSAPGSHGRESCTSYFCHFLIIINCFSDIIIITFICHWTSGNSHVSWKPFQVVSRMTRASEFILVKRTKSRFVTKRKINLWIYLLWTRRERKRITLILWPIQP